MPKAYHLEEWKIEPALLRISRRNQTKKVEPLLMSLLEYFIARPGEVITKEELREAIWAEVIISENVLTKAISSLRKLLEDSSTEPIYIETISKTGYRLIAQVHSDSIHLPQAKQNSISQRLIIALGTLFLLALAAFLVSSDFTSSKAVVFHPTPLANAANTEYWPALSPDGKFVAYSWKGEGDDNWDIYVKQIGTSTSSRITQHPRADLRAKWSPDGSHIYFVRYEKGGAIIYKQALLGGEEVRVMAAPRYSTGDFNISADEKWMSYNDREIKGGPARIKLISLETGESQWLSQPDPSYKGDIHATFSPSGAQLAFIREKNPASMQLWAVNLETRHKEQLTKAHQSINGFAWSPDEKHIYFSADQTGLYKLWQLNLGNKKTALLPVGDYQMVMPRVAENGRMIYAKMQDNVNIWTFNLINKQAKPWRNHDGLELNPNFSPDGTKVSFTAVQDDQFQIWVANTDGSQAKPITRFTGEYLSAARWTPDGQYLLFHAQQNGQIDLFKVHADGGPSKKITSTPKDQRLPFPDSYGQIYFSSKNADQWEILRMDADATNQMKVLAKNAFAAQLSTDGLTLYYCKKDELGLWAFHLETKDENLLISDFHPMHWGAFAVSEKGIFYWDRKNKHIAYLDFAEERSELIHKPSGRIPRLGISLDYSPEAELLIFSQIDHNDADIMLLQPQ